MTKAFKDMQELKVFRDLKVTKAQQDLRVRGVPRGIEEKMGNLVMQEIMVTLACQVHQAHKVFLGWMGATEQM